MKLNENLLRQAHVDADQCEQEVIWKLQKLGLDTDKLTVEDLAPLNAALRKICYKLNGATP